MSRTRLKRGTSALKEAKWPRKLGQSSTDLPDKTKLRLWALRGWHAFFTAQIYNDPTPRAYLNATRHFSQSCGARYRPRFLLAAKKSGSVFYDILSPSLARQKW